MTIKKPLLYSGIAIAAIGLSTTPLLCSKIEQTRVDIGEAIHEKQKAEDRATQVFLNSPRPDAVDTEMKACGKQYADCQADFERKLGLRNLATDFTGSQCDKLRGIQLQDACYETVLHNMAATAPAETAEFIKCVKKVTECYEKIRAK